METVATTNPAVKLRRAGKSLGSTFLVCNAATRNIFIKILDQDIRIHPSEKRDIEYLNVLDLTSGTAEKLMLTGLLKHLFLAEKDLKGKSFEIVWTGRGTMVNEDTGELYAPNQYEVYPLADASN